MAGAEFIWLNGFVGTQAVITAGKSFSTIWRNRWERNDLGELMLNRGFPTLAATPGGISGPNPDSKMKLTSTLSYKGLRLYALDDCQQGGDM